PAPRRTAEQAIADRLKLAAAVLRDGGDPARGELSANVREGAAPTLKQVKFAGIERSASARALGALRQEAVSTFALVCAIDALAASPEINVPSAVRMSLAEKVEELARAVQLGRFPSEVTLELPSATHLSPLAQDLVAAIRDAIVRFSEPDTGAQVAQTEKE